MPKLFHLGLVTIMTSLALACGSADQGGPDGEIASSAPAPGRTPDAPTASPSASPTPAKGDDPPTPPAPPPGDPIKAPERQWTWVDIPGTSCANGSPTGLGVNLTSASDDVLVFLEGGGACWDGASCWGTPAASNVHGYGELQFATDPQRLIYLLNRDDADNPFRDKNLVFVPYCTGDVYSGDAVRTLSFLGDRQTHFVGYRNMGVYTSRLVATLPKAKRVWIAGDSAGGFGAALNFGRVQKAFPGARVDVIDDSGQPVDPDPTTWSTWRSLWNMQLPADCPACATGPAAFVDYYRTKYPVNRFGLISYAYDIVIAPFMRISLATFHDELWTLLDHFDATWTNGRYFVMSGAAHVGLMTPSGQLKDWVKRMASDQPSWGSIRP